MSREQRQTPTHTGERSDDAEHPHAEHRGAHHAVNPLAFPAVATGRLVGRMRCVPRQKRGHVVHPQPNKQRHEKCPQKHGLFIAPDVTSVGEVGVLRRPRRGAGAQEPQVS